MSLRLGSHPRTRDGDLGHVRDFITQDWEWVIRHRVVDTRDLWPGKKVLIPPHAVLEVDWSNPRMAVDLTRQMIKEVPAYDPHQPIQRDYEERLYAYYGWPRYWQ